MKFNIKDNPISLQEIYEAIRSYIDNTGSRPSYILVHPETRRKIMINEDEIKYTVVEYNSNPEKGVTSSTKVFGLCLIQTMDIEPGFIIICG